MPRKPRFYLPSVPAHIVQRGNSRQAVFFCDEDYQAYLAWLSEGALKHGCKIHAYVLMTQENWGQITIVSNILFLLY